MEQPNAFLELGQAEKEILLKAPALVSILAIGAGQKLEKAQENDAVQLTHLRTFTSDPILQPYYAEVEKVFPVQLKELQKQHIPLNNFSRNALKMQIAEVNQLLDHIDREFAVHLRKSLNTFSEHVQKADRNVVEYFVLPANVPDILD
ncbi:MAG: hypothetical protein H6585_02225 [Flavobacteriales bacterium]|nr:hypothetical protein [Flavobacteriales bacterium]